MNLDIGNFNLTSDKYNVTVHERYKKENGSEGLRFIGYYRSVKGALQKLLEPRLKLSDVKTAQELLSAIIKHEKDMEQLIASVDFDAYRLVSQEPDEDLSFLD